MRMQSYTEEASAFVELELEKLTLAHKKGNLLINQTIYINILTIFIQMLRTNLNLIMKAFSSCR